MCRVGGVRVSVRELAACELVCTVPGTRYLSLTAMELSELAEKIKSSPTGG